MGGPIANHLTFLQFYPLPPKNSFSIKTIFSSHGPMQPVEPACVESKIAMKIPTVMNIKDDRISLYYLTTK